MARQLGRQAQLDLAAVAQADRDQHALGQQPGSAIENGGCAACPYVEAGRVDHQRRRPVAAQELAPGEIDRFAGATALGQARRLHALQPLHGRQGLGLRVARQRGGQGLCRRHGARQGRRARVEPRRKHLEVAHGASSPLPSGSAMNMAGVTLAARIRRFVGDAEGEAAGHALGDAGRLQPGIDAIHAVVALDHLARDRVPLRRAPGAGGDAALAADAETGLDEDDAVLLALLHGAGRTGPDAPRILAVEAGHEDDAHARLSADVDRADG